jgi:hypothetical protein
MAKSNKKPSKGRNNAEVAKIQKRRTVMVELYLQGMTQGEIAKQLNVDRQTLWRDLEAIRQEWLKDRVANYNRLKQIELHRIDWTEYEARRGWEKSWEDAVTVKDTVMAAGDETSDIQKSERTKKGQGGDPAFLSIVLQCSQERRKILGLDAPVKIAPTTPDGDEAYTLMVDGLEKNAKLLTTEQLKAITAIRGSLAPAIDVRVTK